MAYLRKFVPQNRICLTCNKDFLPKAHNQIYCCKDCQKKDAGTQYLGQKGISTGTVGAMSELAVSIDLMAKGYETYRALSPSSKCDILAMKNNVSYGFEVRTGYLIGKDQHFMFSTKHVRAKYMGVFIFKDKSVHYFTFLNNILKPVNM
jgi:hypothetical protein